MSDIILFDRNTFAASIDSMSVVVRDEHLAEASLIAKVTSAEQNEQAQQFVNHLHKLRKDCESARVEIKKPLIEAGRLIDKAAKDFVGPIDAEIARLGRMQGDFLQAEIARQKAAAAQAAKELEDAEREKLARLAEAKTIDEAQAIREEFQEKAAEASKAVAIAPPTAQGQRVREDWEIQVMDVAELYKHHPKCVELTPRMSEIRMLLDLGHHPAGVVAKRVIKTGPAAQMAKA